MNSEPLIGQVLHGINNIFTVEVQGRRLQCRIKGKVLKTKQTVYNPIAVGDLVSLHPDPISEDVGWIVERRERHSSLVRWNKKRQAVQVIAANADLLVCVGSVQSPPFRPRFIDRVLVSAEHGELEPLIVVNKSDLAMNREIRERIDNYRSIGYRVIVSSALNGSGTGELKKALAGRTAVFFGQSGVGKSSLLNSMFTELELPVGDISSKYNRGSHTTSFARLIRTHAGCSIIDTPGIREFEIAGIEPRELAFYFPEFLSYAKGCAYPSCRHLDEPDCAVRRAVEAGRIHPDRYESYLRIHDDVEAFTRSFHGCPYT